MDRQQCLTMSFPGTFRKYAELLQRRDERTFICSSQDYTLTHRRRLGERPLPLYPIVPSSLV
jgi:hypothetical protein